MTSSPLAARQFYLYTNVLRLLSPRALNSLRWASFANLENTKLGWAGTFSNSRYEVSAVSDTAFALSDMSHGGLKSRKLFRPQGTLWALFLHAWEIARPRSNYIFSTHREFRLMFLSSTPEKFADSLVSAEKYFLRWVDSYNLLYNMLHAASSIQLLSNKSFIEESLVFNWQHSVKNYKLFKFVQPFFMFKDAVHGAAIHTSIFAIFLQKLDFAIVVDVKNHFKLLRYLQRYSLYTIGLVPTNYSPWIVSYPVPYFSDSSLSQLYFLKWVLHINSCALAARHAESAKLWSLL